MALPKAIKAEVKLTTSDGISVSTRELKALSVEDLDSIGVLAAIFVCGDWDSLGRWIIVNASTTFRSLSGKSASITRAALISAARRQPELDELRKHVDEQWPQFLEAFSDLAMGKREALLDELRHRHREESLMDCIPQHRVLPAEHRATIGRLLEQHGESDAGRIFQDLLAYLLASAGYQRLTYNAVGVPDFTLEELKPSTREVEDVVIRVSRDDLEKLSELCHFAGEIELSRRINDQSAASIADKGRRSGKKA